METVTKKSMSIGGAAFLGIGAMVGAGIFALLGEAGAVAGSAVWVSFLLGGIVATLLGYSVVKLGVRYPSSGGLVSFLVEGFGRGHITGIALWLYYFAGIITTAMVAVSFGSYGSSLILGDSAPAIWVNILATAIVIVMALVTVIGAKLVGRVQSIIVVVLLAVFAVFIVATMSQVDPSLLAPSTYPPLGDITSAVGLTFFAYLGFAVISFTAGDLEDPARQLPRAMYVALGLTIGLYILISLGVFGTLTVDEVIENGDTALAVAARPVLGEAGFTMMAIAALLATASSVNANLYGAGNVTASMAQQRLFPPFFGGRSRIGGARGLVITVVVVLVLANVFDLSTIASLGSAVALGMFVFVGAAAFRLRAETGSSVLLVILAILTTAAALLVFVLDMVENAPQTLAAVIGAAALAVLFDLLWSRVRGPLESD